MNSETNTLTFFLVPCVGLCVVGNEEESSGAKEMKELKVSLFAFAHPILPKRSIQHVTGSIQSSRVTIMKKEKVASPRVLGRVHVRLCQPVLCGRLVRFHFHFSYSFFPLFVLFL